MSPYARKLLDPRWQRKRLEAMEFAGFACERCESEIYTLHVHHKVYRKNFEPWDYEVSELAVLCDACHSIWHKWREELTDAMAAMDAESLPSLVAEALLLVTYDSPNTLFHIDSGIIAERLADAYGLHPDEVMRGRKNGKISGLILSTLNKKRKPARAKSHTA